MRIIDLVQADWPALVDFLELPSHTVRNLTDLDKEDACRKVFELWLEGEGDEAMPQNWHTIISVLGKIKKRRLAEQVHEALND